LAERDAVQFSINAGIPPDKWEREFQRTHDALALALARIEALEKEPNEWQAATRHLLEHYPEDVFPPNSNTPDAKAGTFARRLLTWLLDPVERAHFAALATKETPDDPTR
jgi:hypothetical protein